MQNKFIPPEEMEPHPLSMGDSAGRLFWWKGELLREMSLEGGKEFEELWRSGLIEKLRENGWIPRVELTEYRTVAGGQVLRHEIIPMVTYPCEWSFCMLRDAGAVVLKVNALAKRYGYELKDAHGHNVVFKATKPLFVDLGSFVKREAGSAGWCAETEFRRFYLYPLKVWSISGPYVARRLVLGGRLLGDFEAARLVSSFQRRLPQRLHRLFFRLSERLECVRTIGDDGVVSKAGPLVGALINWMRGWRIGPFADNREASLGRCLAKVRPITSKTEWSGYHQKIADMGIPKRFDRVVEIVASLRPETVLDIGCNEGEFAFRFEGLSGVRHVVALDADPRAIDYLYARAQAEGRNITPVLSDAMQPLLPLANIPQAERLRVDVVVVLALTHHLLLSQGYNVDFILKRLAAFSRRHLMVEFMPLGLWNGITAPPIPKWYTVDWFRAAFSRHCKDIHEEQLEDNRILFRGVVSGRDAHA